MSTKLQVGDKIRIVSNSQSVYDVNTLEPADELVGQVGTIMASFEYGTSTLEPDYDIALEGKKYRCAHRYEALDARFLEKVA